MLFCDPPCRRRAPVTGPAPGRSRPPIHSFRRARSTRPSRAAWSISSTRSIVARRSQRASWRQSRRSSVIARVDLDLSDDQELLRATTERFIESAMPLSSVRRLADTGDAPSADYARSGGELGWFAMLVPEDHGGG